MSKRRLAFLLPLAALVLLAAPPAPDPAKAGMDPAQLQKIAPRMKTFVDQQAVAGTVTLLMRKGALAHLEAAGWQDIEVRKPMRTDTIFQIMSMTKPFTGAAIMLLADEGKLSISDPVERILPEFCGQWMIASEANGTRTLKKPARPITIRDLMTHTSGLPGAPAIADVMVKMNRTLADAVLLYSQQPLEFEPGTRWAYSNAGIATLGRIVEVLSGMSFEKFLETRIFQPLGMVDSYIFLPAEKQGRLAPVYEPKDGKLVKSGASILAGDPLQFRKGAVYSGPEHAMYSTAWDLAQFYQMLLNRGTLNGKRVLSPAAVEIMSTLHTGSLEAGHESGMGYGLTVTVVKDPIGTLAGLSLGAFGHGGAFGTHGWVDPRREMIGVFLVQLSGDARPVRNSFTFLGASAIVEPSKQ
ncbi:MAG: beta-lactamase family protein [Candidatus Solibacter usitatus]|nr:beta-lactamase family protein [Candidatus Solibacter usitatus]